MAGCLAPLLRLFTASLLLVGSTSAQEVPSQRPPAPPASAVPKLNYPDSASGLEHLTKDIVKAQSENDGARAEGLLETFILPNAREWYEQEFGAEAAAKAGDYYERIAKSFPAILAHTFLDVRRDEFSEIKVVRYENSCDDNAAEDAYGILLRRREPIPLYELRFIKADKFVRLFPIVYAVGSFRFLLPPDFQPPAPPRDTKNSDSETKPPRPAGDSPAPRLAVGANVHSAKLIHKVAPVYPSRARSEHVQGTVKLHVVIGKDGQISRILAVNGVCSLAESAVNAVRQWRYTPMLFNGNPVEIDSEIDVSFRLSQ